MMKPRPPQKRTASLKTSLLEQAFAILDQAGPDGVTIRAIARAAGVSHAAPANHFADRRQLLTEMAIIIFNACLDEVEHQESLHRDRAKAYLLALYAYSQSYPHRYDLLWRKDLIDWDNSQLLTTSESAYQDFLRSLAVRGPPAGTDEADIETLGTALWSMVHGYSDLRSTGFFEARVDRITGRPRIEAMLSLLLPE